MVAVGEAGQRVNSRGYVAIGAEKYHSSHDFGTKVSKLLMDAAEDILMDRDLPMGKTLFIKELQSRGFCVSFPSIDSISNNSESGLLIFENEHGQIGILGVHDDV